MSKFFILLFLFFICCFLRDFIVPRLNTLIENQNKIIKLMEINNAKSSKP